MAEIASEIVPINIEDELKQSYLDYAMSVIVGRALPDARDGLKPVHRRVLFAMHELNNDWNKAHKKSARVVGDVIGKYHPHGDSAVYDTIVRMAQPFSLRYLLVDGQGNFGSVDGDPPAAMRYTEIRMSKFAHTLLADIDKETVDFAPNYDGTEQIPVVLPARAPNLLVNGSSGIAVGMATNIPPHNLNEVISACLLLIEKPEADVEEIMQHLPGPDFPTYGIINGRAGIVQAYKTGRGRIFVRARTDVETEEKGGKQSIIIHELPYQVNKARLIEKIAELVKDKKIEGITALRDESDKDGMRVVIELRRGEVAEVVINNLYAHTQLQTVFGINMVALVNGRPLILPVKRLLEIFLRHRREVVTRRTIFELRKARERTHILEGLAVALANIDPIIALIKASSTPAEAKAQLVSLRWKSDVVLKMLEACDPHMTRPDDLLPEFGIQGQEYHLSPVQAQAILDLRLHRLTGLEKDKIFEEYGQLIAMIKGYLEILGSTVRLMEVIKQELEDLKKEFGDKRRTEISSSHQDLCTEDLITDETVVVTLSRAGYVKYQAVTMYAAQRRGGKGKLAAAVKDEDVVEQLMIANTHDTILCFSSIGKVYWIKVYQLPQASRISRGRPIVNMLPLSENEKITAMLTLREYSEHSYAIMATAFGTIKKTALTAYSRPRANGIIALELDEGDELVTVCITNGENEVMLFSDAGKVIRFNESLVRQMGRTARGVRGMRLGENQKIISMVIPKETGQILTATQNGYGKRTPIEQYPSHGRGGQGVISIQISERNGNVVGATQVFDGDEMFLISNKGTMVRTRVDEVSVVGRNTQGVRLITLSEDENLVSIQRVEEIENLDDLPVLSAPIALEGVNNEDFETMEDPIEDPIEDSTDDSIDSTDSTDEDEDDAKL